MKRTIVLPLLALVTSALSGGCVLYSHPAHGRTAAREAPARECRPSQHWENGHCVHNGRGHGARKHDD
jgi:hypothetical protein